MKTIYRAAAPVALAVLGLAAACGTATSPTQGSHSPPASSPTAPKSSAAPELGGSCSHPGEKANGLQCSDNGVWIVPGSDATPSPSQSPSPTRTAPQYTVAQQQAIAAAESYLSMGSGFSKAGLYEQLHSSAGEGFSAELAQFAVNHVKVNWYHQAVLAARGYMQTEPGWSYSGMVQQLSSQYGDQFTLAQAEYAAHAVGL